jgi:16S rRNA (cytidine1402-2'-O)-methyltransferase
MLYLIATPIGNLSDISLRALELLKTCAYILCEDTRRSRILLNHFGIKKPLVSYHKFNESKLLNKILDSLREDLEIALICDAGTPGIADPGSLLIKRCIAEKIPFTLIPGPCAAIVALGLSGFNSERFQFIGFLPKRAKDLKALFSELLSYPGTSICYESPFRLVSTLRNLKEIDKNCPCAVARELTKIHEQCLRGTAETLLEHFLANPPKGELILLLEPMKVEKRSLSPPSREEILLFQKEHALSMKEAIKEFAALKGLPKKLVYQIFHKIN